MFILVMAIVIGFVMAMAIGANDVANSMATAVGAKAITIKQAVIIAGILEFSGAFFFGKMVTETVRKGIVEPSSITDPHIMLIGSFAALISASICVFIATVFELPISTTHSVVGGMAGFGIAAVGFHAINWSKMIFIVASWFVSPFLGGFLAFLIFSFISKSILHKRSPFSAAQKIAPYLIGATFFIITIMFFKKALHYKGGMLLPFAISLGIAVVFGVIGSLIFLRKMTVANNEFKAVEKIFRKLQILTSCYVSLAHGANDVANSIGPLAAIYAVIKFGKIAEKVAVPKELLALGGIGIAVGVAVWGHKVIKTVGSKITQLNNTRGFSIDFATATTVLLASFFGLPISSTHTVVGSVIGVGYARGVGALNLGVIRQIVISWLITVPAAAVLSGSIYKLIQYFM